MGNYFIISKLEKTSSGLYNLALNSYKSNGDHIGRLIINSGAPNAQNFRTFKDQVPLKLEPIPEGEYDLGRLDWAGGWGNYTKRYEDIDSPIWVVVVRSRSIGFHLDGNRTYAPGSAGCPVFKTMEDLKTFVGWYKDYGHFTKCYVDWGLKYVNLPDHTKKEIEPKHCQHPTVSAEIFGKRTTAVIIDNRALIYASEIPGINKDIIWDTKRDPVLKIELKK